MHRRVGIYGWVNDSPTLVLASGSPRRRVLLRREGFDFAVARPDIVEEPLEGELPDAMVVRHAPAEGALYT